MQRARTMDGRPEDGLRHGLPARATHTDTLHAARGAHRHLQLHKLRAHDPAQQSATAAAATAPRAPASTTSATTSTTRARPPTTRAARARARAHAGARRAAGRAAAKARQEEVLAPRPVRSGATATAAAATGATPPTPGATTAAATTTGAPAKQQPGQRPAGTPRPARPRAAVVLEVHAVAAAEVGGDAEAARVLLRGVPVQLPDAGARGHLQHGHRRQQAHHHLQRGEPQRLRHRLSACVGRPNEWKGGRRIRFPSRRCCCCTDERKVGWYDTMMR